MTGARFASVRRKPVPRAWRDEHHWLDLYTHRSSYVRGGGQSYRSGGKCSCGATFGLAADRHNQQADDVRDDWMDHVAEAYHGAEWLRYSEDRLASRA